MTIVQIPLTELRKPDRNVRMHTDKQIAEFKRSIEMFGQIRPIVVDEHNTILAGNGLFEALRALDKSTADCYVVTGLSESEKKKLMLVDNRIYELGVNDLSTFDAFIAELADDLDIPGFDDDLLKSLVMTEDEVSELLGDYGKIEPEQVRTIREAAANNPPPTTNESSASAESAPHASPSASGDDEEQYEGSTQVRAHMICPHCGETIWL